MFDINIIMFYGLNFLQNFADFDIVLAAVIHAEWEKVMIGRIIIQSEKITKIVMQHHLIEYRNFPGLSTVKAAFCNYIIQG